MSVRDMTDGTQFLKTSRLLLVVTTILLIVTFAIREYSADQPGWVPGTIATWPLPRGDAQIKTYGPIAFVSGFDQPIVSSSGLLATLDGTTLRCDIPRDPKTLKRRPVYEISSSPSGAILAELSDQHLAVIQPTGAIGLVNIYDNFSLHLDGYGADADHFVVRHSEDWSSYRRHPRQAGHSGETPVDESWTLPVRPWFEFSGQATVLKANGGRWLALIRSRLVLGNSKMELLDELELSQHGDVIICTGDNEYVVAHDGAFSPLKKVVIEGNSLRKIGQELFPGPRCRMLASSKTRGLLLVACVSTRRTGTGLFKNTKAGWGRLELIDTRQWQRIASHEVDFDYSGGVWTPPWRRAVFSPNGETIFVITDSDQVREIDLDTWVRLSGEPAMVESSRPPPNR